MARMIVMFVVTDKVVVRLPIGGVIIFGFIVIHMFKLIDLGGVFQRECQYLCYIQTINYHWVPLGTIALI